MNTPENVISIAVNSFSFYVADLLLELCDSFSVGPLNLVLTLGLVSDFHDGVLSLPKEKVDSHMVSSSFAPLRVGV
jgi:hypothetical protein